VFRALLNVYKALLSLHWAYLSVYRALLSVCKALLSVYRVVLSECMCCVSLKSTCHLNVGLSCVYVPLF